MHSGVRHSGVRHSGPSCIINSGL